MNCMKVLLLLFFQQTIGVIKIRHYLPNMHSQNIVPIETQDQNLILMYTLEDCEMYLNITYCTKEIHLIICQEIYWPGNESLKEIGENFIAINEGKTKIK